MMAKRIKNQIHSIETRLANIARKESLPYGTILRFHMQSGIIRRISMSAYKDNFMLKGGLFIFMIMDMKSRPTLDIDFLALKLRDDMAKMKEIFVEIFSILYTNDGLRFDLDSLEVHEINAQSKYSGVQVKVTCYLGPKVKTHMHLDIGFGDAVVHPIDMEYPGMLAELDPIFVKAYSVDSVIAEKFQAMVRHSVATGRLKDYYDIHTFLETQPFMGEILQEALIQTFQTRETKISDAMFIFSPEFSNHEHLLKQWKIFTRRLDLEPAPLFSTILSDIEQFLKPVLFAILNDEIFNHKWSPDEMVWKRYM